MIDGSFKYSRDSGSEIKNLKDSINPLASSDFSPRFSCIRGENTVYENRFQSYLYSCLERFLQSYIESVALLKYDDIMNQQVFMNQAVDHLKQQLITQMNNMFKFKNDSNIDLQEFDKYRTIQITIIQNLTDVPVQLKELIDLFLGDIHSIQIMRNPVPLYPIKQQNNFNISIIGDFKTNAIPGKIERQVIQLIQQLYLKNLNDQLHIIKLLQNLISMKIIEQDINEELAKTQIQQLKLIFPQLAPVLSSLEQEITQKTNIPLKFDANHQELIQLIIDKSLYRRKQMINYEHQSQELNSFLQILQTYLENMDNIGIKKRLIQEQKLIKNKPGLAEIQNFLVSTRLINLFEKFQQKDNLTMEDLQLNYYLSEDLQTIQQFQIYIINHGDQQSKLIQTQQQTTNNPRLCSQILIRNQSQLNEQLKVEKEDTSQLDWNDNQIKRLMYDDFKKLLICVFKLQPFQSQNSESVYAKFYLNELYISFNFSNNLYYFLNKKKYNLSQNKKDLLAQFDEINQLFQFGGLIKEILDLYVGNHLSENGFKRHLLELVKMPENEQLDIEAELQQRYSSVVTNIGGLFVVEDQPISQTSSDQLKEFLNKVRSQSINKAKAIHEDQIYAQMKAECYKSIPITEQTQFIFLLKALKKDSLQNDEFCKEAMKYYKPVYKATLEQFQNCENEKIEQALTKILSEK